MSSVSELGRCVEGKTFRKLAMLYAGSIKPSAVSSLHFSIFLIFLEKQVKILPPIYKKYRPLSTKFVLTQYKEDSTVIVPHLARFGLFSPTSCKLDVVRTRTCLG